MVLADPVGARVAVAAPTAAERYWRRCRGRERVYFKMGALGQDYRGLVGQAHTFATQNPELSLTLQTSREPRGHGAVGRLELTRFDGHVVYAARVT